MVTMMTTKYYLTIPKDFPFKGINKKIFEKFWIKFVKLKKGSKSFFFKQPQKKKEEKMSL